MRLSYENYSLRRILFQMFKQNSHCKSFIAKAFDGITIKMKAASTIQVKKNKNYYFQFFLNQTCSLILILHAPFLYVPDRARKLICAPKISDAQKQICPALSSLTFRDIFGTLSDICGGASSQKKLMAFSRNQTFYRKTPSQIFDLVLNMPLKSCKLCIISIHINSQSPLLTQSIDVLFK